MVTPARLIRLQLRHRGELPEPPDADVDANQLGDSPFRRELPRDGPPGLVAGGAQVLLRGQQVHLDHNPVGLVVQRLPEVHHLLVEPQDLFY